MNTSHHEVDLQLESWRKLPWHRPQSGWLRVVRDALGMTTRQLAASMGVSQAAVVDAERAEAGGDISMKTLRRYATAMDCELVYVLLPKRPLGDVVSERAAEAARARLAGNGHSDDPAVFETQVEQLRQKLLVGRRSEIWKRLGPAS
jgi:predicted DNA-binding mobile mystery protein A